MGNGETDFLTPRRPPFGDSLDLSGITAAFFRYALSPRPAFRWYGVA